MKKWLLIFTACLPMFTQANDVLTLDWLDLIPESERNQLNDKACR